MRFIFLLPTLACLKSRKSDNMENSKFGQLSDSVISSNDATLIHNTVTSNLPADIVHSPSNLDINRLEILSRDILAEMDKKIGIMTKSLDTLSASVDRLSTNLSGVPNTKEILNQHQSIIEIRNTMLNLRSDAQDFKGSLG